MIWIALCFLTISLARRAQQGPTCEKHAAIDAGMRLSADFVDYYNSGELGMIFKRLMRTGATLTSSGPHPECRQVTTNMRTTLIEQYQQGLRLEAIGKSTFFSAKDSTVVVNVAHMTGSMGLNPALVDVKLYLVPEEDCTYRIQSMSQTPYGCLKASN